MRQRSDDSFGRLLLVPEIQFAHAAVSRLREPSPPLVTIYGPAGTGKSHLVRVLVREINNSTQELRQLCLTASEFTAELARASKSKTIPEFQESLRRLELFVCEDVQVLEGRRDSQQQLLAILDAILAEGGRVLLTGSKPPGDLANFSSKLRSRSQGGVCAATELPGRASRRKLLMHFAEEAGVCLSLEVADLLAESLAVSPRELRGAVVQLEVLARQSRKPIDEQLAQVVIGEAVVQTNPTLSQITKAVAGVFHVSVRDLKSPGRLQGVVLPRQLAMFAAREWSQQAYADIGKYFGRRSHSTIVHACHRMREKLAADTDFRRVVETIQEQLNIPKSLHS